MTRHPLLFPPLPYRFGRRAEQALADAGLQKALAGATALKDQQRRQAFAQTFGERTDAVRDLAARIRQHVLDHLDHYLELFVERAAAAGAHVHFAADAAQANAICLDIARRRGCQLCVKAKSMVTEETQIVPALEAAGVRTIETDLAEFIIQLDHDAPSHIVTAMIHKDRYASARALQRELGAPYTEDPAQLTQIARRYLRQQYRRADLGLSGANFLVAETGSLVLCTNEGNGRFCTAAPPVHVAFAGIEKIVPTLEHLAVMLKVLARSSTAQPLTIYTQLLTGPRRADEHGGPEELHIILLDNGRSGLLRPATRPILRCIRCGACLNTCPVYRKIGGHAYGSVYSGPIGAILTPAQQGLPHYPDLAHASTLCGACADVCPVRIDIPEFLIQHRAGAVAQRQERWRDRVLFLAWGLTLRHPLPYRLAAWAQRLLLRWQALREATLNANRQPDDYHDRGWVSKLDGPLHGWTDGRDLPTPPARSFRHWWQHRAAGAPRDRGPGAAP